MVVEELVSRIKNNGTNEMDKLLERRMRVMAHAMGSTEILRAFSCMQEPANRHASERRLYLRKAAIAKSCQFTQQHQPSETHIQ